MGNMVGIQGQVCQRVHLITITGGSVNCAGVILSKSTRLSKQGMDEAGRSASLCDNAHNSGNSVLPDCDSNRRYQKAVWLGSSQSWQRNKLFSLACIFGTAAGQTALREDVLETEMSKIQVISELWQFMRENKKYWLAPIIITLVAVGALLALAKGSAIAPFVYTLF